MRDGSRRVDVPYLWPRTLKVSPRPPRLIYLDLNHWITLAKAESGHPEGAGYREVLRWCCDAVDRGDAVFPISDTIYMEIAKIGQYRQRRDLRMAIERVSRFFVITSRDVIATHEVEALLDEVAGPNPQPINMMDYLDWGLARAFGMVGGFRIRSKDGDDTADVPASHPEGPAAFDAILTEATMSLNRRAIEGPPPEEEPEMRARGWNPSSVLEVSERRAKQEIEQVQRFDDDPAWRRGRIRDVVAAREILIELHDTLDRGLDERGANFTDIFPEPRTTRRRLDSRPSFDVAVTLKTSYHRDPAHRWTTNDIHDIDALASSIPYCDLVLTDKAACSHATRSGLAERLGTIVLSDLALLPSSVP